MIYILAITGWELYNKAINTKGGNTYGIRFHSSGKKTKR